MMRIFIEDQQLDVYQDFTQQVTYAVDDLLNLDSKATNFTKTIVIPGTTNNNTLLGNIFEFGNSNFYTGGANVFYNFNASVSAKARIEVNGLSIMKGILRLLKITHDKGVVEYEVALFGELGGLVSAIGNRKLEQIDFSKYNQNWNITNIMESWEPAYVFTHAGSYSFTSITRGVILTNANFNKLKPGDVLSITGTSNNNQQKTVQSVNIIPISVSTTLTQIIFQESVINESGTGITLTKLNAGLGIGYVYPLVNYGNVSYNIPSTSPSIAFRYKDWQYKAFRPAVFVREYMDRIIRDAGYTWESEFFNTNFFRRLIIPNNDRSLQKIGETYYIDADGSGTVTYNWNPTNPFPPKVLTFGFTQDAPLKTVVNNTLNDFTYNSTTGKYTYTTTTSKDINIILQVNGLFSNDKARVNRIKILKNNDVIAESEDLSTSFDVKLEVNTNVKTNDTISFICYFFTTQYTSTPVSKTFTLTYYHEAFIEPVPKGFIDYSYNQLLNFNNIAPRNVQQRDFFTSIMKMFNLMIVEDRYKERHLKIEPDVYFYLTDRTTYLDWTSKVDRSQPIIITPMSEANARYYQFNYKDDSDYRNEEYKKKFNETYGNRLYDNQLEFAKDTQKVEVIFSPTVLEGADDEDKVWSGIYKDNSGLEESISHNIRILQCKLINDVEAYKILDDETVVTDASGITKYMYAGHFNDPDYPTADLNFGAVKELKFTLVQGSLQNNLFNGFYSSYMAEITDKDSRLVQCTMKLSDVDIFNIDWRRYIYIDGILYRLKKIIDWSDDNTCKVELLRVIYTTYLTDAITFDTMGIGSQIWSSENLAALAYNNGDPIPLAKNPAEWAQYGNDGVGCCAFYKYDTADGDYGLSSGYGLFYNQFAITDSRGITPSGWRLPTRQEFIDLDTETGGNALKQAGVVTWDTGNTNTNATGWNALGLGWINGGDGLLNDETRIARYWSSTAFDSDETYYMELGYATDLIKTGSYGRNYDGYNVRLIKI